jgi:hypothetical protein
MDVLKSNCLIEQSRAVTEMLFAPAAADAETGFLETQRDAKEEKSGFISFEINTSLISKNNEKSRHIEEHHYDRFSVTDFCDGKKRFFFLLIFRHRNP